MTKNRFLPKLVNYFIPIQAQGPPLIIQSIYLSIYSRTETILFAGTNNVHKKRFTKAKDCHSDNTEICELY